MKRFCRAALASATDAFVSAAMPSFARMLAMFSGETPPVASAWMNASLIATARVGSISTLFLPVRWTKLLTFLRPVTWPSPLVTKSI